VKAAKEGGSLGNESTLAQREKAVQKAAHALNYRLNAREMEEVLRALDASINSGGALRKEAWKSLMLNWVGGHPEGISEQYLRAELEEWL
jgi:hypothetical protein